MGSNTVSTSETPTTRSSDEKAAKCMVIHCTRKNKQPESLSSHCKRGLIDSFLRVHGGVEQVHTLELRHRKVQTGEFIKDSFILTEQLRFQATREH
jgi:hypothetical protein